MLSRDRGICVARCHGDSLGGAQHFALRRGGCPMGHWAKGMMKVGCMGACSAKQTCIRDPVGGDQQSIHPLRFPMFQ